MGAQGSTLQWGADGGPVELDKLEFVSALRKACESGDFDKYKELWGQSEPFRKRRKEAGDLDHDGDLLKNDVMKWVKFGFRHRAADWREEGIKAARTFLYMPEARQKLVKLDFMGSLSLITMPDDLGGSDALEDEEDGSRRRGIGGSDAKQAQRQQLAAEIICEMAGYEELVPCLCDPSMLNFLCIVLNQVPAAAETVTRVFVKLSDVEKHLIVLMEGSIGDILESFFKTVPYKRPAQGSALLERWKKDVLALGNCAHVLGTMIKYGHQCQVQSRTILNILDALGVPTHADEAPDNMRLLAELARLLYWMCRTSRDIIGMLYEASSPNPGEQDPVWHILVKMWDKCVETHGMIKERRLDKFCVDDMDRSKRLRPESVEMQEKIQSAKMLLCYMNCFLWICLPISNLRWKLRNMRFTNLHLAFELQEEELLKVTLSTVRYLVDFPVAQECPGLLQFLGDKLLTVLDAALNSQGQMPGTLLWLLVDAFSILAMQRSMQELLAERNVWQTLGELADRCRRSQRSSRDIKKIDLGVLFTLGEVAMHPSNRLSWVGRQSDPKPYPPRKEFEQHLEVLVKDRHDDYFRTVASLLLTVFQESKFHQAANEIEPTFRSVLEWWQVNTTAHFEEHREAAETQRQQPERAPLVELLQIALRRKQEQVQLTITETKRYCAPHECVFALTLFSRLALEPKFKHLFQRRRALEPLLGCICTGVWAEAREAAATLANLMWLPDFNQEHLVCWLKFDGPDCIAVDAANVLLPIKTGKPKPVDMGKGMYKSTWGIEFVEGACVILHPDGLRTNQIPGLLTSASPMDTLDKTSRRPYQWLGSEPDPKHFTVTCWFYWPAQPAPGDKVLIQTTPRPKCLPVASVYLNEESPHKWVWVLVDKTDTKQVVRPPMKPGWHALAIVSSTKTQSKHPFEGTKFFLDDFVLELRGVWLPNDFYAIGNDSGTSGGKEGLKPFGLLADFRIYAQTLAENEVRDIMQSKDAESQPDKIVKELARLDAATILAQRLDVPDSAAECLRALGSLATLASQRAKIFNVCGRQVLQMLDSPCPMIRRQAARLMNNLT